MRKIITTAALTGLLLATGGSAAQAVPISPKTCVPGPCVKRTWHSTPWQASTRRTWHGKVFNPATR